MQQQHKEQRFWLGALWYAEPRLRRLESSQAVQAPPQLGGSQGSAGAAAAGRQAGSEGASVRHATPTRS